MRVVAYQHLVPSCPGARNVQDGQAPGFSSRTAAAEGKHEDASANEAHNMSAAVEESRMGVTQRQDMIFTMRPSSITPSRAARVSSNHLGHSQPPNGACGAAPRRETDICGQKMERRNPDLAI